MSQQDYITKKELSVQLAKLRQDIKQDTIRIVSEVAAQILTVVADRFDQVDVRLDCMDARMDKMDERFDAIDRRLDRMDERFDRIEDHIKRTDYRLDAHGVAPDEHHKRLTLIERTA